MDNVSVNCRLHISGVNNCYGDYCRYIPVGFQYHGKNSVFPDALVLAAFIVIAAID